MDGTEDNKEHRCPAIEQLGLWFVADLMFRLQQAAMNNKRRGPPADDEAALRCRGQLRADEDHADEDHGDEDHGDEDVLLEAPHFVISFCEHDPATTMRNCLRISATGARAEQDDHRDHEHNEAEEEEEAFFVLELDVLAGLMKGHAPSYGPAVGASDLRVVFPREAIRCSRHGRKLACHVEMVVLSVDPCRVRFAAVVLPSSYHQDAQTRPPHLWLEALLC